MRHNFSLNELIWLSAKVNDIANEGYSSTEEERSEMSLHQWEVSLEKMGMRKWVFFWRRVIRKGGEKFPSRKELPYKQWLRDENEYSLPAHTPSFAYCLSVNKYLWYLLCAKYWDTTVNKTQSLSLGSLKPSDF